MYVFLIVYRLSDKLGIIFYSVFRYLFLICLQLLKDRLPQTSITCDDQGTSLPSPVRVIRSEGPLKYNLTSTQSSKAGRPQFSPFSDSPLSVLSCLSFSSVCLSVQPCQPPVRLSLLLLSVRRSVRPSQAHQSREIPSRASQNNKSSADGKI